MALEIYEQLLLVLVPSIIALIIIFGFFDNNFNYFLLFECVFLFLFVGFNIIDYYYLVLAILILVILIYDSATEMMKEEKEK